jgi:hypothetical protein
MKKKIDQWVVQTEDIKTRFGWELYRKTQAQAEATAARLRKLKGMRVRVYHEVLPL